MKKPTKTEMRALIKALRGLAPIQPLTYGQSLHFSRMQAAHVRRWADAITPDINLSWLVRQRAIPVNFVASYKLREASGLTTNHIGGRLEMFINASEPDVRQRFSLLHEFKHALDFDDAPILHSQLGRGDKQRQADMIEWIANDFAAHVLMPTALVKREWFKWQDLATVASLFNVSTEAMGFRLDKLGLTGEPKRSSRMYFRSTGTLPVAA